MRQLTGLDSAFLYLETERSPMHIGGVAILEPSTPDGPLTLERLKALLRSRLHTSRTFTQKLVDVPLNLGRPYWVDDPDFDLDAHIERTQLPEPGGMEELRALASWEFAQPLDRDRPLWHLLLVEGLDSVRGVPAGSLALISRVHHAAIDGLSGIEIMAALFDPTPVPREIPAAASSAEVAAEVDDGVDDGADDGALAEQAPGAQSASGDDGDALPSKFQLLRRAGRGLLPGAKQLGGVVGDTLRGVIRSGATWAFERVEPPPFPFSAPRSVLNGTLSKERTWDCVHLELDRIKAVRKATGATVNDVVLTICAGALRRYLEEEKELPDEPLVAMCPISIRTDDQKGDMGNQVSAMLVSLATDMVEPGERLARIMRSAYDSKVYNRAIGARTLSDIGNFVPFGLAGLGTRLYTRMHLAEKHRPIFNLVITNVPGPQIPLYVAGARLLANAGMAPIFDGMGLILAVMSYSGRLAIGVTSCPEILRDTYRFTSYFEPALSELEATVAAEGWSLPREDSERRPVP